MFSNIPVMKWNLLILMGMDSFHSLKNFLEHFQHLTQKKTLFKK